MNNVHTLRDVNKKSDTPTVTGRQLDTVYEHELKEKLYSALSSKAELKDLNRKLIDKYNEQKKEYQRSYSDIGNKIS